MFSRYSNYKSGFKNQEEYIAHLKNKKEKAWDDWNSSYEYGNWGKFSVSSSEIDKLEEELEKKEKFLNNRNSKNKISPQSNQ